MKLGLKVSKNKRGQSNKLDENRSWMNRLRRSRLLAFLPFLLLASLIWILQTLQSEVIRPVYIPIGTKNISKSNGTLNKLPEYLEVQVRDKGIEHLRYSFSPLDTLELRLIQDHDKQEYVGILRRELSDELVNRLSGTATVVQSSFTELKIPTHKRVKKKVPIHLGNTPLTPMGYTIGKISLSPDSVVVYGEEQWLSSLNEIKTEYLGDSLRADGLAKILALKLPPSVYSDQESTSVKISLDELTERSYTLPIYIEHTPQGFTVLPLPSTADVVITIPRSYYNETADASLRLSADFSSLQDGSDVLKLRLSKKPKWVIQTRITPEVIQFIKESRKQD